MFDHLSLGVTDLDRAAAFYDAALEPLGLVRLWRSARAVGYGPPGFTGEAPLALVVNAEARAPGAGFHLALAAPSREAVSRFHAAAMARGAIDEGPPGIREHYDPGYYAAFVRDPDGHRLEVVLHEGVPGDGVAPVGGDAPDAGGTSPRIDRGDLHWIAGDDLGGPGATLQHPHLVVQDDVLNHSRVETVVVVALTSNLHRASEPGNVLLDEGEGGLPRRSVIVVSQVASVEKRRLGARIGALSQDRVDAALAGLRFQQRSFFRR